MMWDTKDHQKVEKSQVNVNNIEIFLWLKAFIWMKFNLIATAIPNLKIFLSSRRVQIHFWDLRQAFSALGSTDVFSMPTNTAWFVFKSTYLHLWFVKLKSF